jgi:hypothetical protein
MLDLHLERCDDMSSPESNPKKLIVVGSSAKEVASPA